MWPTQWIFVLFGLLLVASNNGLQQWPCRRRECGECGGSVCGSKATDAGLTADDCCVGRIKQAEVYCGDSGVAPCLVDDATTCSNGVSGIEAAGVCCVAQCGTCGDRGCGGRASAVGLTEDDCCIGRIMDSNMFCGDSETAPCIIGPEVCGPALTITLEWSPTDSVVGLRVVEPDQTGVFSSNPVGGVGFLEMGPGIETYTTFSGLDPAMVNVIGNYQFAAYIETGLEDTVWTLVTTLVEEVVVFETGNFTGGQASDVFGVDVIDYDPTCEDGI